MLKMSLLSVGSRMPGWVDLGFAEYQKRIRRKIQLDLVEVPAVHRGKHADIARIRLEEERRIRNLTPGRSRTVALDRRGTLWDSRDLARKIQGWHEAGERIALAVGGADGFSDAFVDAAHETWSLSPLTLAHPLVRLVLAEQLYRSVSILEGTPYHR